MEGNASALNDKVAKVLPYAQAPKTDSHTELSGYEAVHEVEVSMNQPVEMPGEGDIDSQPEESTTGPHEMDAGS